MTTTTIPTNDAEIFAEVLSGGSDLAPEIAQWLLTVKFNSRQQARMQELASLANERALTVHEQAEVDRYRRIGTMLSTLHSLARKALQAAKSA